MRRLILGLLFGLLALPAFAQDRPPPALLVNTDDVSKPLLLKRVVAEARIHGAVAETRLTLTFGNPTDRVLAGDLYVPLPEGATVSGYALDVAGVMVDGVVVEKDKARQVFEAEVRKGVDPGLVEWTQGNMFKTRVFPIPAGGSRTVMLRWIAEIERGRYRLPLDYRDPVEEFSLRVEVVKAEQAPDIEAGGPPDLAFGAWRDSYVAEASLKGKALTEDLVIRLPMEPEGATIALEKTDLDMVYVHIQDQPKRPKILGARKRVERLTIFWDASASRGRSDHSRELAILEKWFAMQRGPIRVNVAILRHQLHWAEVFIVVDGDASKLIRYIRELDYDGGTQLGALATHPVRAQGLYLLFSDGLSTFGEDEPRCFGPPVYVISDDTAADHAVLRHAAECSGGAYFNLRNVNEEDVLRTIGWRPFTFQRLEMVSGDLRQLFPYGHRPVTGAHSIAARLYSDEAEVILHYGFGYGESMVTTRHHLRATDAVQGNLVETVWAQKRIAAHLARPERNRDKLIRIGRRYGLVTPGTSLLVLERLEQYVEHRVPPPETLPDMQREYFDIVENMEREAEEILNTKKEEVLAQWKERVAWWERTFDYPPDFKFREETEGKGANENGAVMGYGGGGGVATGNGPVVHERRVARIVSSSPAAAPPSDAEPDTLKKCEKEKDNGGDGPPPEPKPEIVLKPWDPETPYLEALEEAKEGERFTVYMAQRKEHGTSPAFYLDCADFFYRNDAPQTALQVLSNVAELRLDDHRLLRVLGHRLAQKGELAYAAVVFEEILRLRPEEPQSYRDLALILDRSEDFRRAMELLWQVVTQRWDRFDGIEIVALMELNRVIARAKRAGVESIPVDERFITLLDTDVRIVLTWDTDMTDIDIWVTEPSGEKADYSHNLTTIGGLVSRDFTGGYGPEEYILRKRLKGAYTIQANFYGSSSPELTGPTTLQMEIFTNFGRSDEERKTITLRLDKAKDVIHVGNITF